MGTFIGITALHVAQMREPELVIWITGREYGSGYGHEPVAAEQTSRYLQGV
jgi:hypothetical protein